MKQVRDTAAGRSISAFIILNRKGAHVATVNIHYSNAGRVTVDAWNIGDEACRRSAATAVKTGKLSAEQMASTLARAPDYYTTEAHRMDWAHSELFGLQQGAAGGYGYDKEAAAMRGLIIDGHTLADHCGTVPEAEKARARLLKRYQNAAATHEARRKMEFQAAKIGAHWANWADGRWTSLYFRHGFERLSDLGYRVIRAI